MTDKKRPPRFDDIVARSHRPPVRRPDSLFAAAYDAEEARKKAGLEKVSADDFPAPLVDANPGVGANRGVDAKDKKPSFLAVIPHTCKTTKGKAGRSPPDHDVPWHHASGPSGRLGRRLFGQ